MKSYYTLLIIILYINFSFHFLKRKGADEEKLPTILDLIKWYGMLVQRAVLIFHNSC